MPLDSHTSGHKIPDGSKPPAGAPPKPAPRTAALPPGLVIAPLEPTQAQLDAARDWSHQKYGKPIGNDAARGCYAAMLAAR